MFIVEFLLFLNGEHFLFLSMKHKILVIVLFLTPLCLFSQEFEVRSFSKEPNDISAIRFPRKDVNNQSCAIIKILTNLDELQYDCNAGFVGDPEYKTGEIWLYVSPRERRIKIMKEGFLTLNYNISDIIEPSSVWILELVSKIQTTGNTGGSLGFVLIKSIPSEAAVSLEGENTYMRTPFTRALQPGNYWFVLSKEFYYDWRGTFRIFPDSTIRTTAEMIPNFGSIFVSSHPETGASIILDGKVLDQTTPFYIQKIGSGEHEIILKMEMYQDISKTFSIYSGDTLNLFLEMQPRFGEVRVELPVDALLLIDKQEVTTPTSIIRLSEGEHLIEVRKEKYRTFTRTVNVTIGLQTVIKPQLVPITGKMSVETNPPEASVYIDGIYKGLSPLISTELIIGYHSLRLEKKDYQNVVKNVMIESGKMTSIVEELKIGPTKKPVRTMPYRKTEADPKSKQATSKEEASNSSSNKTSQSKKNQGAFSATIYVSYAIPAKKDFWEAVYNNQIERFNSGWGFGLDLKYLSGNRIFSTGIAGTMHFFSSRKPEFDSIYTYNDALGLSVYSVWLEEMIYYLPRRDRLYSYIGGGIGYITGKCDKYEMQSIEEFTTGEGVLLAKYGWGFYTGKRAIIEISFQYNFIFSSNGFNKRYGALNLGLSW